MKRCTIYFSVLLFFSLLSFCATAQTDVLILKRNGANLKTYTAGMSIRLQTIYDQWLEGTLTNIRNDSIFLNGLPFHYKEISAIRVEYKKLNVASEGILLMVAGGGVLFLGAANGLYRKDNAKDWYKPSSYVVSGALFLGGFLLFRSRAKTYKIGRKFSVEYFEWNPNKK